MKSLRSSRRACSVMLLASQALWLPACSGEDPSLGGDAGEESAGSISLNLDVAGDISLDSISYDISGNGFHKTGTLDVSSSNTISGLIGGIPAGSGYTITLSAVDAANSAIHCNGSTNFDIVAGQTSVATVPLECKLPAENGSVSVTGSVNVCPRIDGLSVSPAETAVGANLALSATVTDADHAPAAVTYTWHADGGTITQPNAANATFKCTATGTFHITLDVSDSKCTDTASATVTCSPGATPPAPPTIAINEVESNGGTPGDWTELVNFGTTPVDISGFVFKDNDDTHVYTIPTSTIVAAGAYFVVEEAAQVFGLGSADSVRLFDRNGTLVATYSWTAHAATTYGRCPNATGAFQTMTSSTKGAANDCSIAVKVNEVESNGGTPGDWVELYNAGGAAVDLSGYVFKDNDDTHNYVLPAGSTIAAGGYLTLEEAAFGFGLGAADSARLFGPGGSPVIDSYAWTAHASTTYGRCPNGTGAFATSVTSTKNAANDCATVVTTLPWPGTNNVTTVDGTSVFGSNLSGLTCTGATGSTPAYLWAVRNGPGTLYRMVFSGGIWTPDPAGDFGAGKALKYVDGNGNPDSEGVTFAEPGQPFVYVATERNNDASTVSRPSILRVDTGAAGTTLSATHEWALVADLPVVGANLGAEAITWIPDAFLTGLAFFDESAGHAYVPSEYPNHGGGLFFVGLEANGTVYVYALDHTTSVARRIATIASGFPGVMSLEFDRETGYLWAGCDDTCAGQLNILTVSTAAGPTLGRFAIKKMLARPSTMANLNNEGFAIAPESECSGGQKPVFWSDDGETGGHSIRRDTIPCGAF